MPIAKVFLKESQHRVRQSFVRIVHDLNQLKGEIKLMDKKFSFMLFAVLSLAACQQKSATSEETLSSTPNEGKILYVTHCAGCHGKDLQGTSATTLLKTNWNYGRGRGQMQKNIKYGIASAEMPAFEHLLDDDQIKAITNYIWNAQGARPESVTEIPPTLSTSDYTLHVEKVVEAGLKTPWAIEFVNENRALISERGGSLKWLVDGQLDTTAIQGLPIPHTASSTGGFMDIAIDPNYVENKWIYLAYSQTNGSPDDRMAPALTSIIRGKIENHQWINQEILFQVADSLKPIKGNRWGCRFMFDRENHLFFTIGDMALAMDSQDLGKATGKVFRIHPDGSIPKDNPFIHTPGALPAIYTIGNRNTQGLAQHPKTGAIWSTDHGPMGGDELNILKKGANYGWPIITYGRDYNGDTVSLLTHREGLEQPVVQWTPSIAVCAAAFCESQLFPKWNDHLLIGALAYEELRLLKLENDDVVEQEILLKNNGRVREVIFGPDGALYLLLNGPDMLLRITPDTQRQLG